MEQEVQKIGKLGLTDSANYLTYKEINLPENAKVKYLKAGKENTSICLSDGTVWSIGLNSNFEIGNGKDTSATIFTKAKTQTGD